jgi:hypothetical protein
MLPTIDPGLQQAAARPRWQRRAAWYRRHLSLLLVVPLLLLIAALLAFPRAPMHGAVVPASPSLGLPATLVLLLLAGVGARVVFRRILDAVVALLFVLLLLRFWPQVLNLLAPLFSFPRPL